MANERILVSPGVFTREIDGTVRAADPQGVGPVIIGVRAKGPAMQPIRVKDVDDDEQTFGAPRSEGKDFAAYAARLHLRQAGTPATVIRVLGMSDTGVTAGYTVGNLYAIGASGSNVVALIQASGSTTVTLAGTLTSSVDNLAISISGLGSFSASLNKNDANYIKKILNTDPTLWATQKHVVYAVYDHASRTPTVSNAFFAAQVIGGTNWTDEFITGSTTVVISQPFGSVEYDLFSVGSRFAGESANTEVKVSVRNIRRSPNESLYEYGSFDLLVRAFNDNDRSPVVLESFNNVNLDPNSRNYVVKRVGDRYRAWNKSTKKFDVLGDFENKSKYIYINPSNDLTNANVPGIALPWGFKGYRNLSAGAVTNKATFAALPLVQNMLFKSDFTTKVYWGTEIILNASGAINPGVPDQLRHISKALVAVSGATDPNFSLRYVSGSIGNVPGFTTAARLTENQIASLSTSLKYVSASSVAPSGSGGYTGWLDVANLENTPLAKFTFPICDGFDGLDDRKVNPLDPSDMTSATTLQASSFRAAVDMIANPEEVELTELAIPGIWASKVTDYALEKISDRGDAFYLMEITGSSVDDVISEVTTRNLDSNYAAVYYPSVKLYDEVNDKTVEVPPTTVIPAVMSYSDRVSFPWTAPAGFSRGGLKQFGVTEAKDKLKQSERDRLYENRINPIGTFPQQGVVVFGQKTLQAAPSALDRINVRRMLLRVRKQIARIGLSVVFEPNVAKTWESFTNKINPFLEQVRANAGISEFKVILDARTTTEDLIERNIMYAKLAIKPTRTAEYILLDFFITNNAAGFSG